MVRRKHREEVEGALRRCEDALRLLDGVMCKYGKAEVLHIAKGRGGELALNLVLQLGLDGGTLRSGLNGKRRRAAKLLE